jgi:histidine triad (HIT) family protein
MKRDKDCIFCKIADELIPAHKVYEDDRALAFMDICPINKGHLLVIPKEHFRTVLDIEPELYGHLSSVIARLSRAVNAALSPDGLNVLQLNGAAANQVVPHVHVHLVPRWGGDGVTVSAWDPQPGDMNSIAQVADMIRDCLSGSVKE